MLIDLLKKSDWAFLLDFVSPAFFKVIPPLQLMNNATALAKRTQDKQLYQSSFAFTQRVLGDVVPGVVLREGHMKAASGASGALMLETMNDSDRRALAHRIVEIYFAQIFAGQTVFLDLRLSRFAHSEGTIHWSPAPLLGVFEKSFLNSMQSLYIGFYSNKPEVMKKGLAELGLDWAFDVFMDHFGEGDQSAVRFTMSHFVKTFHDIFMKCKEERKNLRGEFVQLGVILGLMYESLETLGVEVDVRAAFAGVHAAQDRI